MASLELQSPQQHPQRSNLKPVRVQVVWAVEEMPPSGEKINFFPTRMVIGQKSSQVFNHRNCASSKFPFGVPFPDDEFRQDFTRVIVGIRCPQGASFPNPVRL
ncbi:MAG TPA: hypothetical protein V6C85_22305 [Allocoleopsis sp.]